MAPIAGRPFLAWQLDNLINAGVRRVILSVGYRAEAIQNYFGENYSGAELEYAVEKTPLGTGGAIQVALQKAKADRVFVFNGDSLCGVDLPAMRALTAQCPAAIAMCVKHVDDAGRYGAVRFHPGTHQVQTFAEKAGSSPGWINAGVYDLPRALTFDDASVAPFSFEQEVLQKSAPEGLLAMPSGEFFIDIGIPEDYERAQTDIPAWVIRGKQ